MVHIFNTIVGFFLFVLLISWLQVSPAYATGGDGGDGGDGGGGGDDNVGFQHKPPPLRKKQENKEDTFKGGEGFGASPKAIEAWEAAGGRKGTGQSFQKWFSKTRRDWEAKQDKLTWQAKKAGWKASAWSLPYWGAQGANLAGKATQFGLNFVPGMGWVNVSLDTARGAAEGYGEALDKGLSQAEASKVAVKSGVSQGLMSAAFNKFGAGNRLNYDKAVRSVQAAKTARKIVRSNKALKKAIVGTLFDEAVKGEIAQRHTSNTVRNSSPQANLQQ